LVSPRRGDRPTNIGSIRAAFGKGLEMVWNSGLVMATMVEKKTGLDGRVTPG